MAMAGQSQLASLDDEAIFQCNVGGHRRPFMLFRRAITGHEAVCLQAEDELLWTEVDHRNFLDISRTKDDAYITINVNNKLSSEVAILPANDVTQSPIKIAPPSPCSYFVEHSQNDFYAITNHNAPNYKVVSFARPDEPWVDWWPHSENVKIEDAEIFDQWLVLYIRQQDGRQALAQIDLQSKEVKHHPLPEPHQLSILEVTPNPDFNATTMDFVGSSTLHACTNWHLDMASGKLNLQDDHVPQDMLGFAPSQYTMERMWSTSHDGTRVPMTIVHSKHLVDTPAPTLALVYGAYGHSLDPVYNAGYVSLLQRGFRLAYCHVRGGGELGADWHQQGKLLRKANTFIDLEGCIDTLLESNMTTTDQLILKGTSAGGLAVGNYVVRHPDKLQAAVLKVPFVDVLTTMLDPSLPLTLHEADEWGNPDLDADAFEAILSYCPYANVQRAAYPSMLITACMHDNQVKYWQPAKFAAKIRAHNRSSNPILLDVDTQGGHTTYSMDSQCLELAFMLKALGRAD
eukprot:TRINITY_DN8981_c0_g1_i7.p1 TRINITY_DN8981_c0_g1~~TRINITY_DN8981_c0_g1_i7.p1  ORF type:complete len:515 (+),score=98.72 TRINITY_DN8981_c0_g1_i7:995-2539(+)